MKYLYHASEQKCERERYSKKSGTRGGSGVEGVITCDTRRGEVGLSGVDGDSGTVGSSVLSLRYGLKEIPRLCA